MITLWTEARDAAALSSAPALLGGARDPRYLGVLAAALTARYQRGDVPARAEYAESGVTEIVVRRDPADLDRAIEAARDALAAMPADGPDRLWVESTLAIALALRYERSGDVAELGEALALTRGGGSPLIDASRGTLLAWARHTYATGDRARRDLRGRDLSERDLRDADFGGAELTGAVLVNADLTGANLAGATLVGARLDGACLVNTVFSGADLTDAWLIGADLTGAHLTAATLDRAVLTRATVDEATLAGARVRRAAVPPNAQPMAPTCEDPESEAKVVATAGDLVATGHEDGSIRLWDAATGVLLHEYRWWGWRPFEGGIEDDEALEDLDDEDSDDEDSDNAGTEDPPWPEVTVLTFSPDGDWLAAVQRGAVVDYDIECYATLTVWHLGDSRFEPTLKVDYKTFQGQYVAWHDGVELAFSPDSRSLALGFHEFLDTWDFDPKADLHVWNLASGNRLWSQTTDTETWHRCVAYSPDNRLVATGSTGVEGVVSKDWVVVRHVDTGTPVAHWDTEGQTPMAVAFTGNDRVRAVTSGGPGWSVWEWRQDTGDGKQWEHDDGLHAAAYSPDGQRLAAAMYKRVALFDAATGTELWSFAAKHTMVLHFSPDGRWLVAGNWYGVRRYDVNTGVAQPDSAEAITFARNGYWAIHPDGTVHLHDTAGTPVRELDPHRGTATGWQVAGLRLVRPSDLG